MSGPDRVYIDARVARTMATEPDLEKRERGIEQLEYISNDAVQEAIRRIRSEYEQQPGGTEGIFGIVSWGAFLVVLTSEGRLLAQNGDGEWQELPPPPLK